MEKWPTPTSESPLMETVASEGLEENNNESQEVASRRVRDAINATDPTYLSQTLAQRAGNSEHAAGSIYPETSPEELKDMLMQASWAPFEHPDIMEGCTAFVANIPGRLGIVNLTLLPGDTAVTLDDRKGTGNVSAIVEGVRGEDVSFTVLIVGEEEGKEELFTFHPGPPIRPSQVAVTPGLNGRVITAKEAIEMGLGMAKIG